MYQTIQSMKRRGLLRYSGGAGVNHSENHKDFFKPVVSEPQTSKPVPSTLDEKMKVKSSLDSQSKRLYRMLKENEGKDLTEVFATVAGSFDSYYCMISDALALNVPDSIGQHNYISVETLIGQFPDSVLLRCSKTVNGDSIRAYYLCDVSLVSTDDGLQVEFGDAKEVQITANMAFRGDSDVSNTKDVMDYEESHARWLRIVADLAEGEVEQSVITAIHETHQQKIKSLRAGGGVKSLFETANGDGAAFIGNPSQILRSEPWASRVREMIGRLVNDGLSDADIQKEINKLVSSLTSEITGGGLVAGIPADLSTTWQVGNDVISLDNVIDSIAAAFDVSSGFVKGCCPAALIADVPSSNNEVTPLAVMQVAVENMQDRIQSNGGIPMYTSHDSSKAEKKGDIAGMVRAIDLSHNGEVAIEFDFLQNESAKPVLDLLVSGVSVGVSACGTAFREKGLYSESRYLAGHEMEFVKALHIESFDFVLDPAVQSAKVYLK